MSFAALETFSEEKNGRYFRNKGSRKIGSKIVFAGKSTQMRKKLKNISRTKMEKCPSEKAWNITIITVS